ncbi:MAG: HTH-type transcriptional regulator, sugar sensing transcriptional regulator [Patescibacteria group bacterium]|nr:HTH-type transcriptional regulator, sugar sensing transcriptional regulator [Patescibacteria group bacterium]
MNQDFLKKLGLSDKEIDVYKTLLPLGSVSASQIAQELNLPRQTVYSILERLVEQRFVKQSEKFGTKQFAADPEDLLVVLDKQKRDIEENKERIIKEIPTIQALKQRSRNFPKFEYYEGKNGLKRLFESIIDLYKKEGFTDFKGYGVNKFADALDREYLQNFVEQRFQLKVNTKLFIGQGEDDFMISSPENVLGRTIKQLPMDPQKASLYIVGDRLYLFSFEDKVGVMIENKAIARLLEEIFGIQWKQIK